MDDHVIQLLQMVAIGDLDAKELAETMDCSPSTVYRLVQEHVGDIKETAQRAKDAIMDLAVEEYQHSKETVASILDKYAIATPALYSALRHRGIPLRRIDSTKRDQAIIEMYKDPRNTIFDIEIEVGTSSATIYKVLRLNGVKLRRGRDTIQLEVVELP